jgi:hypothetical protein
MWTKNSECNKWLSINEELAHKKSINSANVAELKQIGKYSFNFNVSVNRRIKLTM